MLIQTVEYRYVDFLPEGYKSSYMTLPTLCWSDEDPNKAHITKHYRGDASGLMDIRSYKDLQHFSSANYGGIGYEKPFFHIREDIDLGVQPLSPYPYPVIPVPTPFTEYRGSRTYAFAAVSSGSEYVIVSFDNVYFYSRTQVRCRPRFSMSQAGPLTNDGKYYYLPSRGASIDGAILELKIKDLGDRWEYQYLEMVREASKYFDTYLSTLRVLIGEKPFSSVKLPMNGSIKWRVWSTDYYASQYAEDSFDPWADYVSLRDRHAEPTGLYSYLCAEALRDTTVDTNMLENCLDIFDLCASIKSGQFIKDIFAKRSLFERSSDAWLAYRYSYSTTKSDIESLFDYAASRSKTIARSGKQTGTGLMHVKIAIQPPETELQRLVDRLTEHGIAPNLYNLWDLVPFSFIADWFIDFGSVLDGLTAYGRLAAYQIRYITKSWKWVDEIDRDGSRCKITVYDRRVSSTAPPYVPYVESHVSDKTIVKRMVDAVALFGG